MSEEVKSSRVSCPPCKEAAGEVGVELVAPNAALGAVDLLTTALTCAAFSHIGIGQFGWRGPLPEAEGAWDALLASPIGAPVRAVGEPRQLIARQHFMTPLTRAKARQTTEVQQMLIATAVR